MDPRDIRTWAANHRAAAARVANEARQHPMTANEAFTAALSLLRLDEVRNGLVFARHDPVSAREDRELWETWATLRERWDRER